MLHTLLVYPPQFLFQHPMAALTPDTPHFQWTPAAAPLSIQAVDETSLERLVYQIRDFTFLYGCRYSIYA